MIKGCDTADDAAGEGSFVESSRRSKESVLERRAAKAADADDETGCRYANGQHGSHGEID
jgi:hypothetical protein